MTSTRKFQLTPMSDEQIALAIDALSYFMNGKKEDLETAQEELDSIKRGHKSVQKHLRLQLEISKCQKQYEAATQLMDEWQTALEYQDYVRPDVDENNDSGGE